MPDIPDGDDEATPPRPKGEGVRIIGAEEAAALEARQSGRLPADAPRFGDVPPQPEGPRPPHRFPLRAGETAEPTTAAPVPPDLPHWTEPPTGEVPRILVDDGGDDSGADDLDAWAGLTSRTPRWRDQKSDWEEADFDDASVLADEETRVGALDSSRGEESDLYSFDDPEPRPDPEPEPDPEVEPVAARSRTTRIRTRPADAVADPGTAPSQRAGTQRAGTQRAGTHREGNQREGSQRAGGQLAGNQREGNQREGNLLPGNGGGADRDIPTAIATGAIAGAVALFCFWRGPGWAAALASVIVVLAASEVFEVFRRAGYRPATLLGLVSTAALMVGAFVKGERAVPLVLALTVVFGMLWYLLDVVNARPTVNLGVTFLGVMWVGLLGSFASLMLRYPADEGIAFLLGAILAVVANDIGALFAGRKLGRTPLAVEISPNKTVEGAIGGAVASIVVCLVVVRAVSPWDVGSSIALALVVSVVAPLGDLCESMIKRDIGVKDMGSILPGHGGVVDRFDALLFVLPAVYYLVELLNLAGR